MKWYPYLYVGEGASKNKNKIIRKLKIGAGMIDVWVITEAANGEDQFDILSSAWLKQRAVRKKLPMIYGIAKAMRKPWIWWSRWRKRHTEKPETEISSVI